MNIVQKPSPNFWTGRAGFKPEVIVIHIMDGTLAGTDSWFGSTASQVSAHYGIGTAGEVHQYVDEENTAWHAGRVSDPSFSLYKPGVNPNRYTIGIEHEGNAYTVWSDAMKEASAELIRDICTRRNIPIDREHIIGHYQVFSGKPNCPAYNKSIIDELITLATPPSTTPPSQVEEGIRKIEEGLKLIKGA